MFRKRQYCAHKFNCVALEFVYFKLEKEKKKIVHFTLLSTIIAVCLLCKRKKEVKLVNGCRFLVVVQLHLVILISSGRSHFIPLHTVYASLHWQWFHAFVQHSPLHNSPTQCNKYTFECEIDTTDSTCIQFNRIMFDCESSVDFVRWNDFIFHMPPECVWNSAGTKKRESSATISNGSITLSCIRECIQIKQPEIIMGWIGKWCNQLHLEMLIDFPSIK